jgi:hypothetical protein
VTNATLDETVRTRARSLAQEHLARIRHTMRLENQALREAELSAELDRQMNPILEGRASRMWDSA